MDSTPSTPARACTCRATLVDHVRRTVGHPYRVCPYYGTTTPLDGPA